MSDDEGSISMQFINIISGNIANDCIDFVKRKVETSKPIRNLREKFEKDKIHNAAKTLLEYSLSKSKEGVSLPKEIMENFLNDTKNRGIIRDWILEDMSNYTEPQFENFDIASYTLSEIYKNEIKSFLKQLFDIIKEKKKQFFSAESLNILSVLFRIDQKLDTLEPIGEKISKTNDMVSFLIEEMGYGEKFRSKFPSEEINKTIEDSSRKKLEEIKNLIEKNKITSAQKKCFELKEELQKSGIDDKEIIFLVNAYLAGAFINSLYEQEKAVPYLSEAVLNAVDEEKKYRNQSLIYLLKREYTSGLNEIDKAINMNPKNMQSVYIKVNLLVLDGKVLDAKNLLSDTDMSEDYDMLYVKAYVEFMSKEFSSGLENINEVIKNKPNYYGAYLLHADIVISQIKDIINKNEIIDKHCIGSIKISQEHLTKVIEDLDVNEQKGMIAYALSKRGAIFGLKNETDNCLLDFEESHKILPEEPEILRNLILSLGANYKFEVAFEYIEKLKELKPEDSEPYLIEAEFYIFSGNPEKAIQIIEKEIEKQNNKPQDFRFHSALIDAYDRNLQTSLAEKRLKEFEIAYGQVPDIILTKAKHLKLIGKYEDAIKILESALLKAKNKIRILMTLLIADILCERGSKEDFERASNLYGNISSKYIMDNILKKYASSLYYSNQFSKCFGLCDEVKKIHGHSDFFSELEGAILYKLDNFQPASEIFKVLYQKFPENLYYLKKYAYCLFRVGKVEDSVDALRQAEKKLGDSPQDLAFISTAYSFVGKINESLEFAWRALKKNPNDPNLHMYFIGAFLHAENFTSEIEQKYIETFQDSINNFNKKFPGNKSLVMYKFPKNPEEFRRKFMELLEEQSNRIENAERIYNINRFPVGFLY